MHFVEYADEPKKLRVLDVKHCHEKAYATLSEMACGLQFAKTMAILGM